MTFVWNKPVLTFYRQRFEKPEKEAFLVVQTKSLLVGKKESTNKFNGTINAFFPLMGDIDYVSTKKGKTDKYVLCWFDNQIDDFSKAFRRLTGVTFTDSPHFVTNEKGKRTYEALFVAEYGKLE